MSGWHGMEHGLDSQIGEKTATSRKLTERAKKYLTVVRESILEGVIHCFSSADLF